MKGKLAQLTLNPQQREIALFILKILAAGAILSIILIAPNMPLVFKYFLNRPKQRRVRKYSDENIYKVIQKLNQQKIISIGQEKDKTVVKITEKGQTELLKYDLDKMEIKRPKKWDGCWRLVVFDIPETKKQGREMLRALLKRLNFYPLQKSVFVLPWECEKEIEFIAQVYEISPFVKYILAKKLKNDDFLKIKFNLNL